ncbi:hypothetical protein [Lactococcus garvieae]|uniref:hypothetical protein n=1 Tax=Lactococcus garvieae TaxID=1363 RepID=UPI00289238CB|nr:hypothetical protein [Lactococcus garvieae]MDT2742896.1 hypothetical protein [Lactococcus garvieae]
MNELIFAYIGAVAVLIALICLLSWLWLSWRKDVNERFNKTVKEKLKRYDEFAQELNSQANILGRDEWGSFSWNYYDFEELTKEMVDLRKFKEKYEKALAEIGGEDD